MESQEAAILHYTYTRFSDLKGRRDRCDCAPTEKDVERCFILPFDREAFLASSLKSEPELKKWFRERLVWDNREEVASMIKAGMFTRVVVPQVLMRHVVLKAVWWWGVGNGVCGGGCLRERGCCMRVNDGPDTQ